MVVLVLRRLFTLFNRYLVSNSVTNSSPASTFMFIYVSNSDINEMMPCTGGISLQGDKGLVLSFGMFLKSALTSEPQLFAAYVHVLSATGANFFLDHLTLQLLADHLLLWRSGVS